MVRKSVLHTGNQGSNPCHSTNYIVMDEDDWVDGGCYHWY
jgi:hypothetical protein